MPHRIDRHPPASQTRILVVAGFFVESELANYHRISSKVDRFQRDPYWLRKTHPAYRHRASTHLAFGFHP